MPDPATTDAMLSGRLGNILNFISAAAGLGTAAMGLVDASKAFWGGPSNFGFGCIRNAVDPFFFQGPGAPTIFFGKAEALQTLKANWLNGVAKAEQKAKAKALIHLGLTQGNAAALARAAGVDAAKLTSLAQKTAAGTAPTQEEINVLGQFDVVVSAMLDAAYERGDQIYRNASKVLAMLVATILGGIGGWLVFCPKSDCHYIGTSEFFLSLLVGLSATPLAPIAKDLATSLQSAVSAVRAAKR